jgi:hypothetical protein
MNEAKIKVRGIAYHRNGITGAGFHVVTFTTGSGTKRQNMLGIAFEEADHVAVLDTDLLAENVIAFAENSWRGADHFGPALREAIIRWENAR